MSWKGAFGQVAARVVAGRVLHFRLKTRFSSI